jgi:NAD(P)-dependent dehydrogenase (short-subunit alcohol dehydrogenase family)
MHTMNRALTLAAVGLGSWLAYRSLTRKTYAFRGKNILITGGSRGLGLVMARQFLKAGARVAICARDRDELRRAFDDLHSHGGEVLALACDVTDQTAVKELVATVTQRLGSIDVLVNNAGIIGVGALEKMQMADFEETMKTHFWGSLYTILEVLPQMRSRQAGRIVNISSIGGKIPVPHLLPYTASKFALVGLSQGLRNEVARDGIVVTTVCPWLMRTGSHINAEFHGDNEKEYAWFALGDSMPGLSISAESAAEAILAACARGDAEVVMTLLAKSAVVLQALMPGVMSQILTLTDQYLLPSPTGGPDRPVPGKQSRGLLPEFLTTLSDRASQRNNEQGARPAMRSTS